MVKKQWQTCSSQTPNNTSQNPLPPVHICNQDSLPRVLYSALHSGLPVIRAVHYTQDSQSYVQCTTVRIPCHISSALQSGLPVTFPVHYTQDFPSHVQRGLTGSFFPFSMTLTPRQEPAMSYARRVSSATISLSSFCMLNLDRSGWKVTLVKSSLSKCLILGSAVLVMLFCQVCKQTT